MNEKIESMINDQMNFEFYSAYIYMAMAAYSDSIDLTGIAHWFKIQTQEEMYHSSKMYNYLVERGGRPFFTQITAPTKEWASVKAAFENALEHEKLVTDRINKIMTAAIEENDHASRSFLNWFVDEQVEEEANVDSIIKKLNLVKDSGEGIYLMDKELAARVFVTPPDLKL
ncbi:MAG: ferritin [bacterium]|nr:ferritin [bacterium]